MSRFFDVVSAREPDPIRAEHYVTLYVDRGWAGWRCRCGIEEQYPGPNTEEATEEARAAMWAHAEEVGL